MKAISPVLPLRKTIPYRTEHNLGVSRSKTTLDDPLSLLYNMNDCYSRLKELVPSLPQNRNVSKMEILQHVIDYILDLQIALDSSSASANPQALQQPSQRHLGHTTPRKSVISLSTDISSPSQPSYFPREITSDDHTTISR
uniref:DNA-binding protein inhibitor ID-4 n=1 Tax=Electrophorus electricus TaxID=8005 RepID=A0A4W4F7T1_ELEEL